MLRSLRPLINIYRAVIFSHTLIYRCISSHHILHDQQWDHIQNSLRSGRIPPRHLWLDVLFQRYRAGMIPTYEIRNQFHTMLHYGIRIPSRYIGLILKDLIDNGQRDIAEDIINLLYIETDVGHKRDLLPYDIIQIANAATPTQIYYILDRIIHPHTPNTTLLAINIRALITHNHINDATKLYDRIATLQQCPRSALQDTILKVHNRIEARAWISWSCTTRRRLSRRALLHLFDLLDPIEDDDLRSWTALECALRNCRLTPEMITYFQAGMGRYGHPHDLVIDEHNEIMTHIIRRRLMWAYTHARNHNAVLDILDQQHHIKVDVHDYLICIESGLRHVQWRYVTESVLNNMKINCIEISCAIWHRICNHCLNPSKSDINTLLLWRQQYCNQFRPELRFLFSRPLRYYLERKQYDCILSEIEMMSQAGYHDACTDEATAPIVIKTYLALGWMLPNDLQYIHVQDRPALYKIVQRMSPDQHLHKNAQDRHHLDVVIKSIIALQSLNNHHKLEQALNIFQRFTSCQNPLPRTVFRLLRLCAVLDQVETAQRIIQMAVKAGFNFNERRQRVVEEMFQQV